MIRPLLSLVCVVTALLLVLVPALGREVSDKFDKQPIPRKLGSPSDAPTYTYAAGPNVTAWEMFTLLLAVVGGVLSVFAMAEAKAAQRLAEEARKVAEEAKDMAKGKG